MSNPTASRAVVSFLKKAALATVSFVLAWIVGELTFAGLGKFTPPFYPPIPSARDQGLFEAFAPHGYRLVPSQSVVHTWPVSGPASRTMTWVSNSDGFRSSRSFQEFDPRKRILVLGDSLVFGLGVEASERFTELTEASQPDWRIENLGITGFGPDLMLRSLEHVGIPQRPSVVVLCIYTDDFRRVRPHYAGMGFEIPRYTLVRGELRTMAYPGPSIRNKSRVLEGISKVYWSKSSAEWDLNEAILKRFLSLAGQYHFRPALVFLPNYVDLPQDRQRRTWLRRFADDNATPYLDLTDLLVTGSPRRFFIRGDYHLNPEGHAAVAGSLRRFLAGLVQ